MTEHPAVGLKPLNMMTLCAACHNQIELRTGEPRLSRGCDVDGIHPIRSIRRRKYHPELRARSRCRKHEADTRSLRIACGLGGCFSVHERAGRADRGSVQSGHRAHTRPDHQHHSQFYGGLHGRDHADTLQQMTDAGGPAGLSARIWTGEKRFGVTDMVVSELLSDPGRAESRNRRSGCQAA